MKKYIFNLITLAISSLAVVSCSTDFEGESAGSDGSPVATLYTYAPSIAESDYDGDTDVRLRICANQQTSEVYYEAIKTDEYVKLSDPVSEVLSKGTKLASPGEGKDVWLTGMQGSWTIAVVASDGSNNKLSTTTFYGKTWNVIATGTVRTRFADGDNSIGYGYIEDVELLQDADDPDSYRLKNVFGKGYNLSISIISAADNTNDDYDEDGWAYEGAQDYFGIDEPYRYVLMDRAETGRTYADEDGDYGSLFVGDYYTMYGSDYTYYCRMYENKSIRVYVLWQGSANLAGGWFYFYPDEEE